MNCASPVSAAKLFVQLAPSRCATPPVLDFLLPRGGQAAVATASKRVQRAVTRVSWRASRGDLYTSRSLPASPRVPSLSSTRRFTQVAYNPQTDEDGNEMKLEITPRAAKRLSDIMKKEDNPHLALRIQVESGGCHGFQYLMSLVTLPSALPSQPADGAEPAEHPGEGDDSGEIREDDTIFTHTKEETASDEVDLSAPKIILDQPSLELLKGSKVDYTMELIGSQFKIVDNPAATSNCGCGSSFDIKGL
ncbi:hypothetical protein M406DRAFT_335965 [Cryphonectria parasitica EP155]|uniref:FeS cluster biogenesis domain-containing protein n=1 Tax=Cryphonectria parasitica (strain ATCC 38755 / EP155) TaxID=660469 RepID=A0A9P4YAX9_CRYP1|nr:uncharacterized protein M406DRAFT_335965 [Cryphonectria parasitica EP155]KAF3770259.1 hypothetical protein M406DRAFT_335965 [Cryphonectria parasitica EP155]